MAKGPRRPPREAEPEVHDARVPQLHVGLGWYDNGKWKGPLCLQSREVTVRER